jgi:hypothetical protein
MPRRRTAFYTLYLFRGQHVTYPACRPSIRTLTRRIEALGYEVFLVKTPVEHIPQDDWGCAVTIFLGDADDSRQILYFVPLPRRRRRLTRSGVILGSYEEADHF